MPIYPLYAIFFTAAGLSRTQISLLFAVWSAVGFVAQVPAGVLADRFSRRGALVAASLLQAAGYVVWITHPGFGGFAAGFALWGAGGALVSGALEALLFDGLTDVGSGEHYGRLVGRCPRSPELRVLWSGKFAVTERGGSGDVCISVGGWCQGLVSGVGPEGSPTTGVSIPRWSGHLH